MQQAAGCIKVLPQAVFDALAPGGFQVGTASAV